MPMKTILTDQQLKQEILESHQRSKAYGVCPEKRSVNKKSSLPQNSKRAGRPARIFSMSPRNISRNFTSCFPPTVS